MEDRIRNSPKPNVYPIWVWYQYKNENFKRSHLSTNRFLAKETKWGEYGVELIE